MTAPRAVSLVGAVGALGDELLSTLLHSLPEGAVHVAMRRTVQTALQQFVPFVWPLPPGAAWPHTDEAWLVVTSPQALVPRGVPLQRLAESDLLGCAQAARQAGVQTLVVVAPLAALLQLGALAQALSSGDEMSLAALQFEKLVIVRPTTEDGELLSSAVHIGNATAAFSPLGAKPGLLRRTGSAVERGGHALLRSAARAVLHIMLPQPLQALSARSAARAIAASVAQCGPGIHIMGARELHAHAAASAQARTGRQNKSVSPPGLSR